MVTQRVVQIAAAFLLSLAVMLAAGPATAGAPEITLRAAHDQPLGGINDIGHQYLARTLPGRTNGRIQVQVFPAAQLGAEPVMIEGVRMGSIDIASVHVANFATVVPEFGLFSVSYLFKSEAHLERVMDDPKFQQRLSQIVQGRNLGLRIIGFYTGGLRSLYNRKLAVQTPEDLKGLKLRVMANPIEAKVWTTFGAIPTAMPVSEVYPALQAGVIDGAENCPWSIEAFKGYEAAPYVSLTEHQFTVATLIMNEKRLNAMSPDIQKTMLEVAREASAYQRKGDAEMEAAALGQLKAKGAKINQPDKSKFAALVVPIQDQVARDLKMEDVLAMIRAAAR